MANIPSRSGQNWLISALRDDGSGSDYTFMGLNIGATMLTLLAITDMVILFSWGKEIWEGGKASGNITITLSVAISFLVLLFGIVDAGAVLSGRRNVFYSAIALMLVQALVFNLRSSDVVDPFFNSIDGLKRTIQATQFDFDKNLSTYTPEQVRQIRTKANYEPDSLTGFNPNYLFDDGRRGPNMLSQAERAWCIDTASRGALTMATAAACGYVPPSKAWCAKHQAILESDFPEGAKACGYLIVIPANKVR